MNPISLSSTGMLLNSAFGLQPVFNLFDVLRK